MATWVNLMCNILKKMSDPLSASCGTAVSKPCSKGVRQWIGTVLLPLFFCLVVSTTVLSGSNAGCVAAILSMPWQMRKSSRWNLRRVFQTRMRKGYFCIFSHALFSLLSEICWPVFVCPPDCGFKSGLRISRLGMITHCPLPPARPHYIQNIDMLLDGFKGTAPADKGFLDACRLLSCSSVTIFLSSLLHGRIWKLRCLSLFSNFANGIRKRVETAGFHLTRNYIKIK